jgi:hypothetical protein
VVIGAVGTAGLGEIFIVTGVELQPLAFLEPSWYVPGITSKIPVLLLITIPELASVYVYP